MVDEARPTRLLEWALATFHTTFFFLLFVIPVYLSGNLGQVLSSLNTLVGVAIFVVLWVATTVCTSQVVRQVAPSVLEHPLADPPATFWVVLRSAFWGAVNGFLFLIGLLAILFFVFLTSLLPVLFSPEIVGVIVLAGIYVSIASGVALMTGGVIGFVFALLDFLILGIAGAVLRLIEPGPVEHRVPAS